MTVSAIDYAVLSQAILAAAREMGAKLIRSAYSTILREARDGSAAILDRDGNTVAQAELIPMQLGTIGSVFQACAREYDLDEVGPDDFFVINDSSSLPQQSAGYVSKLGSHKPSAPCLRVWIL